MIIRLTSSGCTVSDPDDCTRLHVAAAFRTVRETGTALRRAGIGKLDHEGTCALIDLDRLRVRAGASATQPDWDTRWEGMIAYAAERGWVSDDGGFVRAHIETTA